MKSVPAGRLTGQILFDGHIPEYNQIGDLIERKLGITYLAVRINSATKLIPADPNGSSDPFVIVEWDGCQQSTRVIYRTLEPTWNQTLYFPLKMVTITQAGLESKPAISVRVFDMDEAGHDLLGSCEIPLHRITSAEHARIEDEIDSSGKAHKGRVCKIPSEKLDLPGHKIQSTIDMWAYFIPDLPLDIHLEQTQTQSGSQLSKDYEARAKAYLAGLAPPIKQAIESAIKVELGKNDDYDLDSDQVKMMYCAEDQDGNEHVYPEYLTAIMPPKDMNTPLKVARMVRMITWSDDEETFKNERRKDIWQTPPFFMEMRKGDMEDHALLLCNLFLGLNMDAYVCIGRLFGAKELEKRHVWVMTREKDASVRMWETSTGEGIILPDRWEPPNFLDILDDREEEKKKGVQAALESARKGRDAAVGGTKLVAKTGARAGLAVGKLTAKAGRGILGMDDDDDEGGAADGAGPSAGAPAAATALVPEDAGGEEGEEGEEGGSKRRRKKRSQTIDDQLLNMESEMREAYNEDELLGRLDIEEKMAEVSMGDGNLTEEQEALAQARARRFNKLGQGAREEMSTEHLRQVSDVQLNYAQLEAVFNNKNLWIPRMHTDPALITYNFEEGSPNGNADSPTREWDAFIEPRMKSMGLPQAFYNPKRLASKPPADRLRAMEHQIHNELNLQIKYARVGLPTIINKSAELEDALQRGLELQELLRAGDKQAAKDLDGWQRDCKSKLPPGSTFTGRVINYSYTDAKKIRKHLLSSTDYAQKQDDGTQFALAVKCFGYHGGIVSVWVYFGLIDTDLLS
mmetsp:Transcript_45249/g.125472  ORF Transcript_45249/g.125472 Transcript_45249/m.125472 type:complete len:800 (+) Transcript_45249:3-2402(+)